MLQGVSLLIDQILPQPKSPLFFFSPFLLPSLPISHFMPDHLLQIHYEHQIAQDIAVKDAALSPAILRLHHG